MMTLLNAADAADAEVREAAGIGVTVLWRDGV
jgi:hypothetical protein